MVNLTSLTLIHGSPVSASVYLDVFESAPHPRRVRLWSHAQIPITGVQNGRLVSLAFLKDMACGSHPNLFDHLLIPVGARLARGVCLSRSPIEGPLPRFLITLGTSPTSPHPDAARDTCSSTGQSLTQCEKPCLFVHALHPGMSSLGVLVRPELEELVIDDREVPGDHCAGAIDIEGVVEMAAARASRGAELGAITIFSWYRGVFNPLDVSELKRRVSRVETRYG